MFAAFCQKSFEFSEVAESCWATFPWYCQTSVVMKYSNYADA